MSKESKALPPGTYQIVGWNETFENSRSRVIGKLNWVAMPNKHDGEKYTLVMLHEDAAQIFAAWNLICQVASKCQLRGTLLKKDGKPHTPGSLSIMTRAPKEWFEKAFEFLSCDDIQWLTISKYHEPVTQVIVEQHSDDIDPVYTDVNERKEGIEQNRTEQKECSKVNSHENGDKSAEMPLANFIVEIPETLRSHPSVGTLIERWDTWTKIRKGVHGLETKKGSLQDQLIAVMDAEGRDPIAITIEILKFAIKNQVKGISAATIQIEIAKSEESTKQPQEVQTRPVSEFPDAE